VKGLASRHTLSAMRGDFGSGANAIPLGGFGASQRDATPPPSFTDKGRGASASSSAPVRRHPDRTVYVGGLDPRVTSALLAELASHAGRVVRTHIPNAPSGPGPGAGAPTPRAKAGGFGFVEFASVDDAEYACRVLNLTPMYGSRIRVRMSERDEDGGTGGHLGAQLYVAGLAGDADEGALVQACQAFGHVVDCAVVAKGQPGQGHAGMAFGRVVFDGFEASDAAAAALHGAYVPGLCVPGHGPLQVAYANNREAGGGKHGGPEERQRAADAQARRAAAGRRHWVPHTLFAYGLPGELQPNLQPHPQPHPQQHMHLQMQGPTPYPPPLPVAQYHPASWR